MEPTECAKYRKKPSGVIQIRLHAFIGSVNDPHDSQSRF